jgi:hypothetical protein
MTIRRKYNRVSHKNTAKKDPIKAATEFGIDISALRDNLKLSPANALDK